MTQVAVAEDVNPPPWRGQWSTTSQIWGFDYDPGGEPPDYERYYEPDGPAPGGQPPLPGTNVVVYPDPPDWMPDDATHGSNRVGIWSLSGHIDVTVENHEPPNEFKWVWVQLTWAQEFPGGTDVPAFYDLIPRADPDWPVTLTDMVDHGDEWYTFTYEWRIYPNPREERFTIGFHDPYGGILVDQLVIDTWCIPEPATLGLLVVGGLLALRRRRV